MAISFDKALGIHEHTLSLRAKRAEVIANNIANADTPGFKAQELDFQSALNNVMSQEGFKGLTKTHEKHFSSRTGELGPGAVKYLVPDQPDTGDGNTVDSQKEIAKYGRNALEYQTTLQFLSNKFKGISKALKGE
ncbi:flagellar basal body rod protein FlgB [Pleionea litopenaei]|uniref:Flagellar basal body rod protein FlgB n=1 Tax=Pleionea litopenaei TaxID=3070815 RepID=A0AA51X806_9GAMM|nr:flagellar basal body rod protein FlgB [Pleionea sp. HL-JVS1]WMS87640.1 flagellar basal body rod protein FlgB [Pleionea sp. HL-JVS1]